MATHNGITAINHISIHTRAASWFAAPRRSMRKRISRNHFRAQSKNDRMKRNYPQTTQQ